MGVAIRIEAGFPIAKFRHVAVVELPETGSKPDVRILRMKTMDVGCLNPAPFLDSKARDAWIQPLVLRGFVVPATRTSESGEREGKPERQDPTRIP